jgi:hypothetical protein
VWALLAQCGARHLLSTAALCECHAQPLHMCLHWTAVLTGSVVLGTGKTVGTHPDSHWDQMCGDALPLGMILPMIQGSLDVVGNVHHHALPLAGDSQGSYIPVCQLRSWWHGMSTCLGIMFLTRFLSLSLLLPMLGKARGWSIGVSSGLACYIESPPVGPYTPPCLI